MENWSYIIISDATLDWKMYEKMEFFHKIKTFTAKICSADSHMNEIHRRPKKSNSSSHTQLWTFTGHGIDCRLLKNANDQSEDDLQTE